MSPRMPTSPRSSRNVGSRVSPTQSPCASSRQWASRRRQGDSSSVEIRNTKSVPRGRSSCIDARLLWLLLRLFSGVGRIHLLLIDLLLLLHILPCQQHLLRSLPAVQLVANVRLGLGVRVRRTHRNLPRPKSPRHRRRLRRFGRVVNLGFGRWHLFVLGLIGRRLILRLNLSGAAVLDRKSTRLNSSHANISYAVFCL